MQRIFDGPFSYGELEFLANTLVGEGAETALHAHAFPHVALFWPGDDGRAEYEVVALKDGEEISLTLDAWGFAYIEAGVRHRIRLKKGAVGKFVCLFSRVGLDGTVRGDPKRDHGA